MAATVTPDSRSNTNYSLLSGSARGLVLMFGTVTMDDEYATSGEALSLPGLATGSVAAFVINNKNGYSFEFDKTDHKLKAYYCDLSAGTDAAQIQVASSVDLSGVTADFICIGF